MYLYISLCKYVPCMWMPKTSRRGLQVPWVTWVVLVETGCVPTKPDLHKLPTQHLLVPHLVHISQDNKLRIFPAYNSHSITNTGRYIDLVLFFTI